MDDGVDNHEHSNNSKESEIYERLMKDAQELLYPRCDKFSKFSFILKLFQIKCVDGMRNKAFTNMLQLFKSVLPKGADLPSTYYEAWKMITDLGFGYEKIEACANDCMLFWKENSNLEECLICSKRSETSTKVLRYFPITTRLQSYIGPQKQRKM